MCQFIPHIPLGQSQPNALQPFSLRLPSSTWPILTTHAGGNPSKTPKTHPTHSLHAPSQPAKSTPLQMALALWSELPGGSPPLFLAHLAVPRTWVNPHHSFGAVWAPFSGMSSIFVSEWGSQKAGFAKTASFHSLGMRTIRFHKICKQRSTLWSQSTLGVIGLFLSGNRAKCLGGSGAWTYI